MGHGIATDLAAMVVQEDIGLDMALQVHLGSNRYPPATFMAEVCKAAIVAVEQDDPDRLIALPTCIMHLKYGTQVPASEIVTEYRLAPFVMQDPDW